jgi:hypothetical protein
MHQRLQDSLSALEVRAKKAEIRTERSETTMSRYTDVPYSLRLYLPRGNEEQAVPIHYERWESVPEFEKYRFVEGYQAVFDTTTGIVNAALVHGATGAPTRAIHGFEGIPGVAEKISMSKNDSDSDGEQESLGSPYHSLSVESSDISLEISQDTPFVLVTLLNPIGLRPVYSLTKQFVSKSSQAVM